MGECIGEQAIVSEVSRDPQVDAKEAVELFPVIGREEFQTTDQLGYPRLKWRSVAVMLPKKKLIDILKQRFHPNSTTAVIWRAYIEDPSRSQKQITEITGKAPSIVSSTLSVVNRAGHNARDFWRQGFIGDILTPDEYKAIMYFPPDDKLNKLRAEYLEIMKKKK